MRGIGDECKKMQGVDTFMKGNLDVLGLYETRLRRWRISEWKEVRA